MILMIFESFGYTMDTMYFSWMNNPVDVDNQLQLPQFSLLDIILNDCSQNYTVGSFTCLQINFVLKRDIGYFLIQVYVPSILIVLLSCMVFWIRLDDVTARVTVGLSTVFSIITLSMVINSNLPHVSYVKAMDIWISTCIIFVFIALLEFIVVNVIFSGQSGQGKHRAKIIDKISRLMFPVAFVVFNVVYWILYTMPLNI